MIEFPAMENGGFRPNVAPPTFENSVRRVSSGQPERGDGFANFQPDEVVDDHDEVLEVSESNWSVPPISCRDTRSQFYSFMLTVTKSF